METRRRRCWRLLAALAMMALAVGVAACGGDDEQSSAPQGTDQGAQVQDRKIYLNAYAQEVQYFRDWHDGAMARAKELQWEVDSEFGNATPEQQVQQVQNAIVKQPDAILVTPIDEKSLEPVLRQAKDAGITVLTVGASVSDESIADSFVARSNYDLGVEKAKYVVDQLNGKGRVAIVRLIRGLSFTEDQGRGYTDVLSKEPGIEVVDDPYAGGVSSDVGLKATANLLTANRDIDAIIFDADDIALGGIRAVKERGIAMDDILLIGTDGGDQALKSVAQGDLDMTISLCGYAEGLSAVDLLNDKWVENKQIPKRVVSKVELFTTENVEEKRASLEREDCA